MLSYYEQNKEKINVQIISWRANNLKSNGTLEEFQALVKYMEKLL